MVQKSLYLYVTMNGIGLNAESQVSVLRMQSDALASPRALSALPVPSVLLPPLVLALLVSLMRITRRGHGSRQERSRVADRRARPIG